MDKKIDLDEKAETAQTHVKIKPDSKNSITMNKRISLNTPININPDSQSTFKITKKRKVVRTTTNPSRSGDYDEELEDELDDDEFDPEEDDDEETEPDEDNDSRDDDKKEDKDKKDKKDEKKDNNNNNNNNNQPNREKVDLDKPNNQTGNSNIGNNAGNPSAGTTPNAGTPTSAPATGGAAPATPAATGGSGAAATSGGAAAGSGAAATGSGATAAAGGGAAAAGGGGAVAGGAYVGLWVIVIILIILLIIFFISVIIAIFNSENNYMYGRTCPTITIENTDCNSNNENCTNQYDESVSTEDYIAGVIAAKTKNITTDNIEYFKTLAVIVRTYTINNLPEECTVNGNNSFQEYISISSEPQNHEIILKAVQETATEVILKNEVLLEIKDNDYDIKNENKLINNGKTYEENIKEIYGEKAEITKNIMILTGANGFVNPMRVINCTSAFGKREAVYDNSEEETHTGLDLGISEGEPIYAAKDGKITKVEKNVTAIGDPSYGYGNHVIISHGDGTVTLYAHMKYGSIPSSISEGVEVIQGQQIGQVGATGYTEGAHLHYEIRINGNYVDPANYMDLSNATGVCKR